MQWCANTRSVRGHRFPQDAFTLRAHREFIGCMDPRGTVRVFRQRFTLEDAIGSHACSREARQVCDQWHSSLVSTFLAVHTVNCVQTTEGW
jgi:hypothetical protein